MVRAAAKNFASLAVVVDPEAYPIAAEAAAAGGFTLAERQELATIAFTRTGEYDDAISDWMLGQPAEEDGTAEQDEDGGRRSASSTSPTPTPPSSASPPPSATERTRTSGPAWP